MAYKRTYFNKILTWIKKLELKKKILGVSAVSVAVVGFIFGFLVFSNSIEILEHSGDMVCAGTKQDPCYAYINFTAKEDVYIYPKNKTGYVSKKDVLWADFDIPVAKVILQRSWGKSWRTINLSKTWSKKVEYAVKFHKNKTYQIRMIGYKNDPTETIKWGFGVKSLAFNDYIDPYWYGIQEDNVTWELTYLELEEPYALNIDKYSIKRINNCISFEGRFWTDNATSIPSGNKYLGISFNQTLESGNLSYRNFESQDSWTVKKGNDFSFLTQKKNYDYVYYTGFDFIKLQDKEFKVNVCFSKKPTQAIIYFGTNSTVIEITEAATTWKILTPYMNWTGSEGQVQLRLQMVNATPGEEIYTDPTETAVNTFYTTNWQISALGGGGKSKFIENGSIRTKFELNNSAGKVLNYHYFNTNWWTTITTSLSANYSFAAYSLKPQRSIDVRMFFGDGTHNGTFLDDPGSVYHSTNESWACWEDKTSPIMAWCHFWSNTSTNCDNSYTKNIFADTFSKGGMIFIGGSSAVNDQWYTSNCKFTARSLIFNESDGTNSLNYRRVWNSTFQRIAITVTNGTGTTLIKQSAQELFCEQNGGECNVSLVFKPQANLTAVGGNPDVVFLEIGNFTGTDIYIYNRSDTSAITSGDLLHHLNYNGTTWTFGLDDPEETSGTAITNPSTELRVQVCDSSSSACNVMGDVEHYVVFMGQGFQTSNTQTFIITNLTLFPPAVTNCTQSSNITISNQVFMCDEFLIKSNAEVYLFHSNLTTNKTIVHSGSKIIKDVYSKIIHN